MGNRSEASSVVRSTLTGLIDDNFNENEEDMFGSDVSGSDASESDLSNRIRVNLDGLNMDGIEVDEQCDSDDSGRLDSERESDSDGQNKPEFNLENDMSNPRLKFGMLFKSKDSLKEAAKQYGEYYKEKFIVDPNYSLKSLQQDVKRDLCCIVSLTKCRRAKLKALELIEGAHKAQYEKIYEYLLEACKDGYKASCRRIIGLDGCFLKGDYGGYLLASVRIDANNDIYPLAYAAVESENQASWLWFLELLAINLEIVSSYQISFMSDN
ncbi:hypothetical protein J1N35_034138 [Gossypium stocksii]|uniref:MULE transposase domain-containing protein n=1 Tax=Gossypium stocksii TaxID=47602 RepID=A0A9D3URF0_9ROSI|nr:hypothetical protein J1N35_034138 [Gossypium stocksii]